MVFCPQNILKTVKNSFDEAILKIIHVSLSGNKTTCPEMGRVKVVFDGIVFHLRHCFYSNELTICCMLNGQTGGHFVCACVNMGC